MVGLSQVVLKLMAAPWWLMKWAVRVRLARRRGGARRRRTPTPRPDGPPDGGDLSRFRGVWYARDGAGGWVLWIDEPAAYISVPVTPRRLWSVGSS